jgi:YidC/Oxa1 family membrane protein insertase
MELLSLLWNTLLLQPVLNLLLFFYFLIPNLGVSILLLTLAVRLITLPTTLKSLKISKKQRDLMPELDKIKKKYKHDKKKQAELQMALFKEHGINPASGCLTSIPTILIMIVLYRVIFMFSSSQGISSFMDLIYFDFLIPSSSLQTQFLAWNLTQRDPMYILPVLAGIFQFISSKMMMPAVAKAEKVAEKTPDKSDDIAYNMQQQMLFMMPLLTVMIGLRLPAGTVLYLVVSSIYSIIQSYLITGWGGLEPQISKIKAYLKK